MTMEGNLDNKKEVLFGKNNWILRTTLEAVEESGEAFKDKLLINKWSADEVEDLWLGFHEALINAIAHGNLSIVKPDNSTKTLGELIRDELEKYPEKKNKKVHVMIDVDEEKVYIKISDEGKGFKRSHIPDPMQPEQKMKTKGKGLFYMEKFYDSMENIIDEKGNHAVFLSKERKK